MAEEVKTVKTTVTTETKSAHVATTPPPSATTKNATPLGTATMALRGLINPNSVETTYWFEFGTDPNFVPASTRVTEQRSTGAGTHETHVEADVSDLYANTVYYYRLVAENAHGKVFGSANSFHTSSDEQKPGLLSNIRAVVTRVQRPLSDARTPQSDEPISLITNVFVIAALIILILVLLWGLLHLVSLSSGWFSSLFPSRANSAIQVTAPADANSGEAFALNWKYAPSVKGSYAFVYQCKSGLAFAAPTNGSFAQIPCGVAYTLGLSTSSVQLLPLLSGTTSTSVPLTVLYLPSATSSTVSGAAAQGSATVLIHPAQIAVTPPPAITTAKPVAPVYTSPADLSVSILSANVDAYGNAAVSFDIANVGGSPTGTYFFTAQLPTSQPYAYSSPSQASLSPGSHIVSTLNFTAAVQGMFTVSIGSSNDANSANNYASQYLNASAYAQPQYNSYQTYNQYPQPGPQNYNGTQQCYFNGQTYVCNQTYDPGNGLPYYVNSSQYPYIVPGSY